MVIQEDAVNANVEATLLKLLDKKITKTQSEPLTSVKRNLNMRQSSDVQVSELLSSLEELRQHEHEHEHKYDDLAQDLAARQHQHDEHRLEQHIQLFTQNQKREQQSLRYRHLEQRLGEVTQSRAFSKMHQYLELAGKEDWSTGHMGHRDVQWKASLAMYEKALACLDKTTRRQSKEEPRTSSNNVNHE